MKRLPRSSRLAATLATALVCALAVSPSALARPALDGPPSAAVSSVKAQQAAPRTVIERVSDGGFHVGDAAIGGGIAAALILVALGALAAGPRPRVRFIQ